LRIADSEGAIAGPSFSPARYPNEAKLNSGLIDV